QERTVNRRELELSPNLKQPVKTQNSANGRKIPLDGGLSYGFVSAAVYTGVQVGGGAAAGNRGIRRRSSPSFEVSPNVLHRWRPNSTKDPATPFQAWGSGAGRKAE